MRKLLTLLSILFAALPPPLPTHAARERAIIDLGGQEFETWSTGINDSGDVVGIRAPDLNELTGMRGLWWTKGRQIELPPLPGDIASRANQINNRGQVVGASLRSDGNPEPVLWENGRPRSLGLPPGAVSGQALDTNDRGEIVGVYQLNDSWTGEQRSFIWRDGVISDLLPLPPGSFSAAWGINNRGEVVGQAFGTVDGRTIAGAYVWTNGTIRSLGSLGGQPGNTMAFAINERGEITGQSQTASEEYHAFLWRRGTIIDIGTLPGGGNSVGLDINNRGDIVGQADPGRGFIWRNGTMIDLGVLGADFSRAEAINERGDIAGLGFDLPGRKHGVVWSTDPQRYAR